jgi:hypothetical protein
VRSAVTQEVSVIEVQKVNTHAALPKITSGQLRFSGSKSFRGRAGVFSWKWPLTPSFAGMTKEKTNGAPSAQICKEM